MKPRRLLFLLFVMTAILLLSLGRPVFADPTTTLGDAGAVYPVNNDDVRLAEETVQAVLYRSFAEFRIDLRFVNEGDSQSVRLGFPYATGYGGLTAFRLRQNDKELQIEEGWAALGVEAEVGPVGYYLAKVKFPPGETMITICYLAAPTRTGARFPALTPPQLAKWAIPVAGYSYDYWLHTGATWKGAIDKAVVRVTLADSFDGWAIGVRRSDTSSAIGITTWPETYEQLDQRTYQWVFSDLEPTRNDDITFAYTAPFEFKAAKKWSDSTPFPEESGILATVSGSQAVADDEDSLQRPWAVDGDIASSWPFPAPDGGEQLELTLQGSENVREIRIVPGQAPIFGEAWKSHPRPRTLQVTLSDGTATTVELVDEPGLQRFPLSGHAASAMLEVLDAYGSGADEGIPVAEIEFGTEPAPPFEPFSHLIQTTHSGGSSGEGTGATGAPGATTGEGQLPGSPSGLPSALLQHPARAPHFDWVVPFTVIAGIFALIGGASFVVRSLRERRSRQAG
jgi:hypothetical protein